jgi:2-polyprenyl-3-methyl-5-hydroxy-6-metoxy-1,4-benzoquinol methylase
MRLASSIPGFLKQPLRQARYFLRKMTHHPKGRDELYRYWRDPEDAGNLPKAYLSEEGNKRSQFLVDTIKKYADPNAPILEIGCNAGRNLNFLFSAGYRNLEAIEISEQAINLLKQTFPEVALSTKIYNLPTEEVIRELQESKYDVVFTMAVLEHIHTDSEWIFPEIVRITKGILLTIEDERGLGDRHFPRNYRKIFESLGMKQIAVTNFNLEEHGLSSDFFARVFRRPG